MLSYNDWAVEPELGLIGLLIFSSIILAAIQSISDTGMSHSHVPNHEIFMTLRDRYLLSSLDRLGNRFREV